MHQKENQIPSESNNDPDISQRKLDHINLAFESSVEKSRIDNRFIYEPMLSGHPDDSFQSAIVISGKPMKYPIWVSSMTGGTEKAKHINFNLAKVCNEFGLGMGLGSCRQLLFDNSRLSEFDVRAQIGNQPLFANLGIAQLEELLERGATDEIDNMVNRLGADGLFIHINPLQEWMQPEGDKIKKPPIESIQQFLENRSYPIMVKEVGQGFGKESLRALLQLPIAGIELAGNGGTNFAKLELLRSDKIKKDSFMKVAQLGHSAEQMILWINELDIELGSKRKCNLIIASGGVKDFLDGYYLNNLCKLPTIYAQASSFLKYALQDYKTLKEFVTMQIEGYKMANSFLTIASNS